MKKIRIASLCVALIGAAALAAAIYGQEKKDPPAPPKILHFGDLKWTPPIKGCDLAAVAGRPHPGGTPFGGGPRPVDRARIPGHLHPHHAKGTVPTGTRLRS